MAVSLFSCRPIYLLTNNFSGDVVSSPPLHNIPGSPVGDSVAYNYAIQDKLKISLDGSNKCLEYSDVPIRDSQISGHLDWLSFRGVTTDLSKTITFTWTGKIDRGDNDLVVSISDGFANAIARLTVNKAGEIRICDSPSDYTYRELVGTINYGSYHTITVIVDPLKNTYTLGVVGAGVLRLSTDDDPRRPINVTRTSLSGLIVVDREQNIIPKPQLSFNWYPKNYAGRKYTIASIYIKRN
ncbi:hypothetical protein GCM10027190_51090 [Spirosoma areae]